MRRSTAESDTGSAMVEFTFLGLLLMVPVAYVMFTVFQVQSAAYAVSAATREAGRAFTTASAAGIDPQTRATMAAAVALADHGHDLAPGQLSLSCSAQPCLTRGAAVTARIDLQVPLPLLPRFLGDTLPASVRVSSRHVEYVDRFRAAAAPAP